MKRLLLPLAVALTVFGQVPAGRTVYVLPMAGGLDQYLARSLTRDHTLQVVVDPKAADLLLTDRLGESFEQKIETVHPLQTKKDDVRKDEKDRPAEVRHFQGSAGRGTVFLVDTKTRQVVWSDYEKPSGGRMDRTADRIARRLRAFSEPKK